MKTLIFILVAFLMCANIAQAHLSKDVLSCDIFQPLKPFGKIRLLETKMLPNGLLGELYDINDDELPDIATYSPIYGLANVNEEEVEISHGAPILYELDLPPQDRSPDYMYLDRGGKGVCSDLAFYYDLTKGASERPQSSIISWDGTIIFYFQERR